jgi:membrane-bound lytic murein transglycosylase B
MLLLLQRKRIKKLNKTPVFVLEYFSMQTIKAYTKNALFYFFVFFLISSPISSSAQTSNLINETQDQKEARLRAELAQVEAEQRETEKILVQAQNQSSSLKRDILILDTKIKAAELNIKAKNILIESLGKDINQKVKTIDSLSARIDRGHESLAQILRKTNEIDDITLPEVFLTKKSITDIFSDLDSFDSVQSSLKNTFEQVRNTKAQTETEKNALDKRRNQEMDAKYVIEQERISIKSNQGEKQRLLTISKNNEQTYSQIISEKQKQAAKIKAALFALRDSESIPFGEALKYANSASKITGVRPAFLLAILTQESSLGANVGTCYLTDTQSGAGISIKSGNTYKNVMKPERDVAPFLNITKTLGLDPMKTKVSCPQSVGWGGAMGPAQFIPSTWMLFKDRIASATGTSFPNPWNPQDAFMASAIYLGDLGAISGSYTGEQNAACKYYSGKSCSSSSLIRTYGTQVMAKADNIQRTMINPLNGI